MARVDTSQADALIAKIEKVPDVVFQEAVAVGRKAALNIKNGLVQDARRSRYFRQVAATIGYDEKPKLRGVEFVIGPDKDKTIPSTKVTGSSGRGRKSTKHRPGTVGNIANIAYFGGANGGGGTLDFDAPAQRELANIEEHLADVIAKAMP